MGFFNEQINDKRGASPQCQAIINALRVFPCLAYKQMDFFLQDYIATGSNWTTKIANFLSHENYVYMGNDCIYLKNMTAPDESLLDTVWVAIDLFKDRPSEIATALRTSRKPEYPCTAMLFKDNSIRYKILPIYSTMDFAKIYEENDIYMASDNKDYTSYIVIMRNPDLFKEFAKTTPVFPFQVALLEGSSIDGPTITYYDVER